MFEFFGRGCFVAALLAVTMFFVLPSFAADDEMTVSVPEYVKISKHGDFSHSVSVTSENTVTLPNNIDPNYSYNTNSSVNFYINATVQVANNKNINAWIINGRQKSGKFVLVKNDGSASEESVLNALGNNPTVENNPNVIAFEALFDYLQDGMTNQILENNMLQLSNYVPNGRFWVIIGYYNKSSLPGTFSPHDSAGVYTATVTVTTIAP